MKTFTSTTKIINYKYFLNSFFLFTGCSAQNLRIFPVQKQQTVAVGKSVVLTCQADAADPGLVTQPQWKDPKGLVINEAS